MTVLITQGQSWEAFAEAFRRLDLSVQRNAVQRVFMHKSQMITLEPLPQYDLVVSAPAPKKRSHHDQFIQRHIRSPQRRSRRP